MTDRQLFACSLSLIAQPLSCMRPYSNGNSPREMEMLFTCRKRKALSKSILSSLDEQQSEYSWYNQSKRSFIARLSFNAKCTSGFNNLKSENRWCKSKSSRYHLKQPVCAPWLLFYSTESPLDRSKQIKFCAQADILFFFYLSLSYNV